MNKPVDKEQVHGNHQQSTDKNDKKVGHDYTGATKPAQNGHTPSTKKHTDKPWEKSSVPSPI